MTSIAIPVDENDVPKGHPGRAGVRSRTIAEDFMKADIKTARVDRTQPGMDIPIQNVIIPLRAYVDNHELPIKVSGRGGEIYLFRTDM